jgi:hypothetical protein
LLRPSFELSTDKTRTRIAVACVDDTLRRRVIDELSAAGTSPVPTADLSQLPVPAPECDVTLVFAEGFPTGPLLGCLERCLAVGLALVVVSDDTSIAGITAVGRRRMVTIPHSTWAARGVEAVLTHCRTTSGGEVGQSAPELPFTD